MRTPKIHETIGSFHSADAKDSRASGYHRLGRSGSRVFSEASNIGGSPWPQNRQKHHHVHRPLRVLKFGGTSVGDASSISKAVRIIEDAATTGGVLVVVSAMSGVTNKLIRAANLAAAGDEAAVDAVMSELRHQHVATFDALVVSGGQRHSFRRKLAALLEEYAANCRELASIGRPTAKLLDAISGLGERLSAPLVAAALNDRGVAGAAMEGSELIITNADHGAAEPLMGLTTERCHQRLQPLLQQGIIPVVTGFIGGTESGVLTTLGRGGSDYSATIVAAALGAEEVIIWTDVDGILTADPCMVPNAATIRELSYREAAELAHFGAKVLHPKAIRPLLKSGITMWIRNTFSPEQPGTKIVPERQIETIQDITGLATMRNVTLIRISGPGIFDETEALDRAVAAVAAAQAESLVISQSSTGNEIFFLVPSSALEIALEALRREFSPDLQSGKAVYITNSNVALLTEVIHNVSSVKKILDRTCGVLMREKVNVHAYAAASSECTHSFVLALDDIDRALLAIHREFQFHSMCPSKLQT